MRKWICLGVIGGLLEFGVVYQIAFSEPDSSAPQTPRVTEADSTSRLPTANRTTQRPARHLTTAAGTAGVQNLATAPDPDSLKRVSADSPPATAGAPTFPVENISLSSAEVTTALTQTEDLLTATLIAAASVVAAVPAVLDQLTGAAPRGRYPDSRWIYRRSSLRSRFRPRWLRRPHPKRPGTGTARRACQHAHRRDDP